MELKVKIIGADSIGVRSMATVVCAGGVKILVDPGVSYAPRRYGLPPHEIELQRVREVHERIVEELADADIVVITHYHYDHYLYKPEDLEHYRGKWLIVKDPKNNINVSQRIRAHRLLVKGGVSSLANRVDVLDSNRIRVDDGLYIEGSPPVPHGADGSKLGYLAMVLIECCGVKFVHASDVQGPMSEKALNIILHWKPDVLFISGPPTYFEGFKVPEEQVRLGLQNLQRLGLQLGESTILIADHHFARDLNYPVILEELSKSSRARIVSAAEFMGVKLELLEARRKELWGKGEATDSD